MDLGPLEKVSSDNIHCQQLALRAEFATFTMNIYRSSCIRLALIAFITFVRPSIGKGDTIGFFYALDADLQGLKTLSREMGPSLKIGTRAIQRIELGIHTVYAVRMGSGAVETAASAQALLTRILCDWAFSLGPAGALTEAVEVGKWYRIDRILAWQHALFQTAQAAEYPAWTTDWSRFPAAITAGALQTTATLTVASGEQFISTSGERDRLQANTQANVVDMNSYGLALVCADHGVPLFSWKIISDRADEAASETFRGFLSSYSGEGGKALAEVILSLPANPNDPSSYPNIEKILRELGPEMNPHPVISAQP